MAKIILKEQTTPDTPSSGDAVIFVDTADSKLKKINAAGVKEVMTSEDYVRDNSGNIIRHVTVGEDIEAGDGKGTIFFGYNNTTDTISGLTDTYNIGDTVTDSRLYMLPTNSGIIGKYYFDGFTKQGNPGNCTVTFSNIENTGKTLLLTSTQMLSGFDLYDLYYTAYGEYIVPNTGAYFKIEIDTPSTTDYYITTSGYGTFTQTETPANGSGVIQDYSWTTVAGLEVSCANLTGYSLSGLTMTCHGSCDCIWKSRVLLNGTPISNEVPCSTTPTARTFTFSDIIILKSTDTITFQAYDGNNQDGTFYWTDAVYTMTAVNSNGIVADGLIEDKVYNSNNKFTYTSRCDGIAIESGVVGDNILMQEAGYLEQSSVSPGSYYYVDENNKGKFSTVKPSSNDIIIGIGKTSTKIKLVIEERNYALATA